VRSTFNKAPSLHRLLLLCRRQ